MKNFKEFLLESSNTDLAAMDVTTFEKYAKWKLGDKIEIESIVDNYRIAKQLVAKRKASIAVTALSNKQVHDLQKRLLGGDIDLKAPFSKNTKSQGQFPRKFTVDSAVEWLESGMAKYDGSAHDDKIRVISGKTPAKDFSPVRHDISVDDALDYIKSQRDIDTAKRDLRQSYTFICTKDNQILDGHNKWLAAMLVDPTLKLRNVSIDLSLMELMKLTKTYAGISKK